MPCHFTFKHVSSLINLSNKLKIQNNLSSFYRIPQIFSKESINSLRREKFAFMEKNFSSDSKKESDENMSSDAHYFQSYSTLGIHHDMIRDRTRTEAYKNAIEKNSEAIRGKVVLDVGCGTGILSIFAAKAGAKKVYAVDASNIAIQAKEIVKLNNLENVVTVLHSRVEDIDIEKVDVLISEWMGYMLLYESMLDSVVYARNKFLKQNGIMFPSHANLYIAPISSTEKYNECIHFWKNVYGIDMSNMIPFARNDFFSEPLIEEIGSEDVLTFPYIVKHINCKKINVDELLKIKSEFKFVSMFAAKFHAFALWFDVIFENSKNQKFENYLLSPTEADSDLDVAKVIRQKKRKIEKDKNKINDDDDEVVILSTAPEDLCTHWSQTVLYLNEEFELNQDSSIDLSLTLSRNSQNARLLHIDLDYKVEGKAGSKSFLMN